MEIDAMDSTRGIVNSYGYVRDQLFAYNYDYLEFESNRVWETRLRKE